MVDLRLRLEDGGELFPKGELLLLFFPEVGVCEDDFLLDLEWP